MVSRRYEECYRLSRLVNRLGVAVLLRGGSLITLRLIFGIFCFDRSITLRVRVTGQGIFQVSLWFQYN
jgi:hypothetical protein